MPLFLQLIFPSSAIALIFLRRKTLPLSFTILTLIPLCVFSYFFYTNILLLTLISSPVFLVFTVAPSNLGTHILKKNILYFFLQTTCLLLYFYLEKYSLEGGSASTFANTTACMVIGLLCWIFPGKNPLLETIESLPNLLFSVTLSLLLLGLTLLGFTLQDQFTTASFTGTLHTLIALFIFKTTLLNIAETSLKNKISNFVLTHVGLFIFFLSQLESFKSTIFILSLSFIFLSIFATLAICYKIHPTYNIQINEFFDFIATKPLYKTIFYLSMFNFSMLPFSPSFFLMMDFLRAKIVSYDYMTALFTASSVLFLFIDLRNMISKSSTNGAKKNHATHHQYIPTSNP